MSNQALDRLKAALGEDVIEAQTPFGDGVATIESTAWHRAALFLRDDADCVMNHFIELTATDYPDRDKRFAVTMIVRSMVHGHRLRVVTHLAEGESLSSLCEVWAGANWAEREIWDMFGVPFENHPDLRRILLYPEFEGHPLRKDYPIERTQPLVAYRDVKGVSKLAPFGPEEGQPWTRVNWSERLAGEDQHVSPSIAVQHGQRPALSSEGQQQTGTSEE